MIRQLLTKTMDMQSFQLRIRVYVHFVTLMYGLFVNLAWKLNGVKVVKISVLGQLLVIRD